MKAKFIAAVALALWLAVTGWLATMVVAKPAVLHLGGDADETMEMAGLRNAIARNHGVQAQLASLRPTGLPGTRQPLVALPPARVDPAQTLGTAAASGYGYSYGIDEPAPAVAALDVTLVMNTDGRRSAIVDGQHVRVGSRLDDGTRVRAIDAGGVRLQRPGGEQVDRRVRSPFTAGGAR